MALHLLIIILQMRNDTKLFDVKPARHVPLGFEYAEGTSFALPIQHKALHPNLLPFSSKKLHCKGETSEDTRPMHR